MQTIALHSSYTFPVCFNRSITLDMFLLNV
uniref:Uncharacterized protein n=1 Tax=Anguilla anguilla TaxID=7936 RepID=A0A0E9TE28_ANGAN